MKNRLAEEIGCRRDEVATILKALCLNGNFFKEEHIYVRLLSTVRQIVYLRIAGVEMITIVRLWQLERKLIELLHGDSQGSESWMIDGWAEKGKIGQRLFLSRYAIGADLSSSALQPGLNFTEVTPELFAGVEMGEDALRVLKQYKDLYGRLTKLVRQVQTLLLETVRWAKNFS